MHTNEKTRLHDSIGRHIPVAMLVLFLQSPECVIDSKRNSLEPISVTKYQFHLDGVLALLLLSSLFFSLHVEAIFSSLNRKQILEMFD